jgi:mRNA-degrading endonuclease HigB of HigAB toxin-antitoxin module
MVKAGFGGVRPALKRRTGGNNYRLAAWVNYQHGVAQVRFSTHRDYEEVDALTV